MDVKTAYLYGELKEEIYMVSKPIACMLGGGKAPRLSEVHCDRDSVCVKTDTRDLGWRSLYS